MDIQLKLANPRNVTNQNALYLIIRPNEAMLSYFTCQRCCSTFVIELVHFCAESEAVQAVLTCSIQLHA